MEKVAKTKTVVEDDRDILLIGKVYKSFENLEANLSQLQLEEPLFMTGIAKKSFADAIFSQIKKNREKMTPRKTIH